MSNKLLKTTLLLGTIAAVSAGMASILSNEDNRKHVKSTTDFLTKKADKFIRDVNDDYQKVNQNLNKYIKSKNYKDKIEDIAKTTREIIKQLESLKQSSSELLKDIRQEARK